MTPTPGCVLHAVTCSQGMYSDHQWWVVALYLDRALAEAHRERAQLWLDHQRKVVEDSDYSEFFDAQATPSPYDTAEFLNTKAEYAVSIMFVHADPENFQAEEATLMDYAREQGWIPS